MKIVIAPDSFKESLSAEGVASAIEAGWLNVFPEATVEKVPVADGGEGTTEALVAATSGEQFNEPVQDPLGREISAHWGLLGETSDGLITAVVECASASGLECLSSEERDPLIASTYGTGQLILKALDKGARRIILGLGGSATNDGGVGMLSALGAAFLDSEGNPLPPGGEALHNLSKIDLSEFDSRLADTEFLVACDVDNPLLGPRGASAIFGPQKGATPELVERLDKALAQFADIAEPLMDKQGRELEGAGAAGGLGFGLVMFLNARLAPGVDLVLEAVQFKKRLEGADLVITGEGRMDGQSLGGKTPVGVARWAKEINLPVIAICGSVGEGAEAIHDYGIDALFPILAGITTLDAALKEGAANLQRTSEQVARVFKLTQKPA